MTHWGGAVAPPKISLGYLLGYANLCFTHVGLLNSSYVCKISPLVLLSNSLFSAIKLQGPVLHSHKTNGNILGFDYCHLGVCVCVCVCVYVHMYNMRLGKDYISTIRTK